MQNKHMPIFAVSLVLAFWAVQGKWSDNGPNSWLIFFALAITAGVMITKLEPEQQRSFSILAKLGLLAGFGSWFFALGVPARKLDKFTDGTSWLYFLQLWGVVSFYVTAYWIFNRKPVEPEQEEQSTWESNGPMTASQRRMSDVAHKGVDKVVSKGFMARFMDELMDVDKAPKADIHIDQTDYLSHPKSVGHLPAKLNKKDGVFSGKLLDQAMQIGVEDRAVIIGPPGTGKTAFLVTQLMHWAKTKQSFVCLDIKPEIWGITREALEREGYRVLVFNPTSEHTLRYNVLDDLETPEAIGELVANTITGTSEENAVFYETARDLLDCMIGYLKARDGEASLPDVRALLGEYDNAEGLLGALKSSSDKLVAELANELSMVAESDRLFASVVASLRSGLRFLRYPAIRQAMTVSDFTLAELCSDQPVALFLQFEEGKAEVLQRLTAMMIGHIMRYLIDHTDRAPVLLLLDEIGNAKGVTGLISKLNTIRSRRLPTWMYWQSSSQMGLYSDKDANGRELIFGACDFVGVFRLNDNETAQYISEKIGTVHRLITQNQEAFTRSTSKSKGWSDGGGGDAGPGHSGGSGDNSGLNFQRSKSLQEEPVIKPHELQELPDGVMVCMYRGDSWKGEATPYYKQWPEYEGVKPAAIRPYPQFEIPGEPEPEPAVSKGAEYVSVDELFKNQ